MSRGPTPTRALDFDVSDAAPFIPDAAGQAVEAMYNTYIMRRTQIYLTDGQGRLLERRSKASGQSVSELIRSAVDETYVRRRAMSQQEKLRVARRTAGSWTRFPETGAAFVERIRGSRRLARLHGCD